MNGQPPQQQMQLPTCSEYLKQIPFGYRALVSIWIITKILDMVTGFPSSFFPSNIQTTFWGFQFWRLFTGVLFEQSILVLMIVLINLYTFLPIFENKHGTVIILSNIIFTNLIIQILSVFIIQFFYTNFTKEIYPTSNGIVGIWVNLMIKFCYYNPASIKFCCTNWKFQRKYYPLVFLPIFCILDWNIRSQLIAGLIIAVIEICVLKGSLFNFKIIIYEKIENLAEKIKCTQFQCWIKLGVNSQENNYITFESMFTNLQSYSKPDIGRNSKSTASSFQGKRGFKLSDADSA